MAYVPGSRNMDTATRAERMAKREAPLKQQRGLAEEFKDEVITIVHLTLLCLGTDIDFM